jgi:uncharacterized protein YbjT (DUF2867 family)
MEPRTPKILVIGGTGMLGRPVVVRLFQDGFNLRVMSTNPDRAKRYFGDQIEYAKGDVRVRESIRQAMAGCDCVYINLKGGPTIKDYEHIEEQGSKNIYLAAKETGIKKVVQISEARADEEHRFYIGSKVKFEAAKALKASHLTYIILKPTWFCESLPLMIRAQTATLVGSGRSTFRFITTADYSRLVSECFQSDKADNKSLIIFGPEMVSLEDALARFIRVVYPETKIKRMPLWLARYVAAFSFNKKLRALVRTTAFFEKNDDSGIAGDSREADRLFGPCTTTIDEYARMYRQIVKGN